MGSEAIRIDRPDDARVAAYAAVRDRDLLGAAARPGTFVGESWLVVDTMLERPSMVESVFVAERHLAAMQARLAARCPEVPLYVASDAVLEGVVGFNVHRGVLAIGRRPDPAATTLDAVIPRRERLTLLLCEDINNADNMGGLYRNAAAFGVDAVVLSPSCHDHLYRKAIRVSVGHALRIPTARSADWLGDLARLRNEWGVQLVAAATGVRARPLDAIEPRDRVALVVGTEASGLPSATLAACDAVARIPMVRGIDSLNVGVAAAVCLHRLSRADRV